MKTLKNKTLIDLIFSKGKTYSSGLLLAKVLDSESSEFLFAVSSKNFKRAVDRNQIKRLMRESVRKQIVNGKSIAIIYIGEAVPTFSDMDNNVKILFSKI